MNFTSIGVTPYSWIVDYKIGYTLVLVDNFPDAEGFYMTKIQYHKYYKMKKILLIGVL
jgi:hypothetical protein